MNIVFFYFFFLKLTKEAIRNINFFFFKINSIFFTDLFIILSSKESIWSLIDCVGFFVIISYLRTYDYLSANLSFELIEVFARD